MSPAHVIHITTPKGVVLNGLWYGPTRPQRVIIVVHGLTGSAFSMASLTEALLSKTTAVMTFNNRGFEQIATVKRVQGKTARYLTIGGAHEKFTDCVDDIEGAVRYAKECGSTQIFLAGHSTGAQKAVYWASKNGAGVAGIVLLGPLSDYAGLRKTKGEQVLMKGIAYAKKLVASGRSAEFMPERYREAWFLCDAQRYVSLYAPDSIEEIFPYAQPKRVPKALRSVQIPLLVLLAGKDEYGDRPPERIAEWFRSQLAAPHQVTVVPDTNHGFKNAEKQVASLIKKFTGEK